MAGRGVEAIEPLCAGDEHMPVRAIDDHFEAVARQSWRRRIADKCRSGALGAVDADKTAPRRRQPEAARSIEMNVPDGPGGSPSAA